jgi:hypothetical protein
MANLTGACNGKHLGQALLCRGVVLLMQGDADAAARSTPDNNPSYVLYGDYW